MRIAFVSTFPPMRCAIGIYTEKLALALAVNGVEAVVVAEDDGSGAGESSVPSHRVYRREGDYRDAVFDAVMATGAEVAHFEYAPDLFGEDDRLPSLVARLDRAGVRTVVTLHTVYGSARVRALAGRPTPQAFHRALAKHAHLVVHHAEGMQDELIRQGIPKDRISVIAHGTTVAEAAPKAVARERLHLPADAFLFTFFGFIHRFKNVHTAVEGFLRAANDMPGARLLIMGMPWGDRWYNHLYVGAIRARVACSKARHRVEIRDEYVAPERVSDVYAASDVILLPHRQRYGSASGVFHQAVGFGRPVLAARGPKFVEARALFRNLTDLTVRAGSSRAWARAMRRVFEDGGLRESARAAVADFAARTSWANVALEHAALYRRLISSR